MCINSFAMSEIAKTPFEQLRDIFDTYVGNEKGKLITQTELLSLMVVKSTSKKGMSGGSSKILKSGEGLYFEYVCQILRILNKKCKINKALYVDGDNIILIDRERDIDYLADDSNMLKIIDEQLREHVRSRIEQSKKKKTISK